MLRWHWNSLDRGLSPILRVIRSPLPRHPSLFPNLPIQPPNWQGPGPQLRLVRLFLSLLRDLLPHQPGLLLSCPEIETFCLQQTALAEGVALFQQLKLLQSIYL